MNLLRKNKSKKYIVNLKGNRVQFKEGNAMYGLWWSQGEPIKVNDKLNYGESFKDIESALELIEKFHNVTTVKK